jgi:DNA invertase Pin-like site-specific DNA recombinase
MMVAAKQGGKRIGYVRVSSVDQNEARQVEALADLHIDKTFIDKASGKDTKRPQLQAALDYMRDGDVMVVPSMDRLARNT